MAGVSIIIPVHNGGPFLKSAVQSAIAADGDNQVIVVDDGSTDGAEATLAGCHVRIIRQPQQGAASARNTGLRYARTPYVTFLDADDILLPDAILWRVRALEAGRDVIGGIPGDVIDAAGTTVRRADLNVPATLTQTFFQRDFFPAMAPLFLFRRQLLAQVGGFDESLPVAEDLDLLLRVLAVQDIPIEPRPVICRRLHDYNASIHQVGATWRLRPAAIDATVAIYARHGISVRDFTPWEVA
jgi:glycosyltransferase involved in cell wall biosynthesis